MVTKYPAILADVLDIMSSMAEDWEYGEEIEESTLLVSELGFESLDLVVIGTSLQERYGRMPFGEFLADIGQRTVKDATVGELVTFVHENAANINVGGDR
jgi:acyl carrier protein